MRTPLSFSTYIVLIVLIIVSTTSIAPSISIYEAREIPLKQQVSTDTSPWTPIDVSSYTVTVAGETIGSQQGQPFAGWYTDTVAVDPDTETIIVAWARGNSIYLAFFKPVDADGDGEPEAYQKIIKYVDKTEDLESLDSLTIGTINGQKYVLLTWTYYDATKKNNVKGALYSIDGAYQWSGNIRATPDNEEYSRSCYVPAYNGGNGGFLIIWYEDYYKSIDGKWLYYDGSSWQLSNKIYITSTGGLEYQKADQLLCIGGEYKALVVYRYLYRGDIAVEARLIEDSSVSNWILLYDDNSINETVGVHGAYITYNGYGFFAVPFVSGTKIGYAIIREYNGYVEQSTTYPGDGAYPYIIGLNNNRFVMTWVDGDGNGVKVGNIIPDPDSDGWREWYIYYTEISSNFDKHPLISYDLSNNKYIVVWTGYGDTDIYHDNNIRLAVLTPNSGYTPPFIDTGYPITLLDCNRSQSVHGLGLVSMDQYVVVYTDTIDGEEDLLGYVTLPGTEDVSSIQLYRLPGDSSSYNQSIFNLISSATKNISIAIAFFQEENPGSPGTISKALVDAKNKGVDVKVILDNDTDNQDIYNYLISNGVSVINDEVANDAKHIMHDKFIVVDSSKVLLSTANFVFDDIFHNNNTAIYIESKAIAYFFEQEFLQMWNSGNGKFGTDKTVDYSFIAFIKYSGRTIVFEGYFSPQDYTDKKKIPNMVYGYISRAQSSVYFASYIFTNSSYVKNVYEGIVNASNNGCVVKGVFDELLNLDSRGRRIYWFIDNGTDIAIDVHPYKMHAKLFTIDNKVAIIGSWNPTKSATINHDEYILVIRDPDTTNGFAKQIADYILSMYNDNTHFVKKPYKYVASHPIIYKVMFKPDSSGSPNLEWIEIYNPSMTTFDLSNWVIGDSENLIHGDNEGMYKFPAGTILPGHGSIIVAYNGTAFLRGYGFMPNFEIIDTSPSIPDLQPHDTSKFTGSWDLDDSGDEVILAEDQDGFLLVIDAVWYGNSNYITGLDSGKPYDISGMSPGDLLEASNGYDAVRMAVKYHVASMPPGSASIGSMAGLGGVAEPYISCDVLVITLVVAVLLLITYLYRRIGGIKLRALSKLIAIAILVSVTVALTIAITLWLSGLYGVYTKVEKLTITAGYSVWDGDENVWVIVLDIKNKGTGPATIDHVFINSKPVTAYTTIDQYSVGYRYGLYTPDTDDICLTTDRSQYVSTAVPNTQGYYAYVKYFSRTDSSGKIMVGAGGEITLVIIVPGPGYTGNVEFNHGMYVDITIHTASGANYPASVTLV